MLETFFGNNVLTLANYLDFGLRMIVSLICGALIGLEREKRLKNAGLRTHIIVCMASCLMMIVSKYGFMDVVTLTNLKIQADASRIAQGVVTAIGFLGAGVIFVRRESVIGLTTAAGLWATVGIGIAVGSGLYVLALCTTLTILIIQWILHNHHRKSHAMNSGVVGCNLTTHNLTFSQFSEYLASIDAEVKDMSIKLDSAGNSIAKVDVIFRSCESMNELADKLQKSGIVDSMEIYPTL